MLALLGIMRRIHLGWFIVLLLSLILKHKAPVWFVVICLFVSIPFYFLLVLFTHKYCKNGLNFYLEAGLMGSLLDTSGEKYFSTFFMCIILDVFSPILCFTSYFGGSKGILISIITTYITILFYYLVYIFI